MTTEKKKSRCDCGVFLEDTQTRCTFCIAVEEFKSKARTDVNLKVGTLFEDIRERLMHTHYERTVAIEAIEKLSHMIQNLKEDNEFLRARVERLEKSKG